MKNKIVNAIHIIIVLSTIYAVVSYIFGGEDVLGSSGIACFKYYTTDSNIVAACASYCCLRYKKERPHWVTVFQFVGTVAVSITFLTVIFFLVPTSMADSGDIQIAINFFAGNVFFLHLSSPILAVVAFFLSEWKPVTIKETFWAIVPVFVYSMVYLVLVAILGIWNDWYGFTFGGQYQLIPIVLAVMYACTLALAFLMRALKKLTLKS